MSFGRRPRVRVGGDARRRLPSVRLRTCFSVSGASVQGARPATIVREFSVTDIRMERSRFEEARKRRIRVSCAVRVLLWKACPFQSTRLRYRRMSFV
jgi:hypothetical protein